MVALKEFISDLNAESVTYKALRNTRDLKMIQEYIMLVDEYKQSPQLLEFAPSEEIPEPTQPWEQMQYIKEVVNMDESDGLICNEAKDFIVYNKNQCPQDATVLTYDDTTKANPKLNLGKRSCLKLTGFTSDFWNTRYDGFGSACNKARNRINNFNFFIEMINDPTIGIMDKYLMNLFEMQPLLLDARKNFNALVDTQIQFFA